MSLSAPLAGKLGRLIPRLASDHDGEVIATVRAIRRTLASERLDLHDFARSLVTTTTAPAPASGWHDMLDFCLARADWLNDREAGFVRSLAQWIGTPTERQRAWLTSIFSRLQGAAR